MSASAEAALKHLRKKKPLDGWSVETKPTSAKLVRLLRRNVPLTDTYYLDLHYDPDSDAVVGILTPPNNRDGKAQAQVLVDSNGKPSSNHIQLVSVSSYKKQVAKSKSSVPTRTNTTPAATARQSALADAQNGEILRYAGMILGGMIVLRILFNAMAVGVYILVLPLLYFYLLSTCPSEQSFDAKKELKRVLRGHHLPEDHPDKPKGFLGQTLARINASVATELATGLGYEVTLIPLAAAAIVVCVRVPTVRHDFYWIGAAHKWWYVYSTEMREDDVS